MEGFEIARFRRAAARLFGVNMRITRTTRHPAARSWRRWAASPSWARSSTAATRSAAGTSPPGSFVAFLTALFAMYTPVKRLSRVNATLQAALAAGSRIFEVLDTHQEVREAPGAVTLPRLREGLDYEGVGFRYEDSEAAVIRNVSFSARRGEVVAIVGTSGAGKTTLVNLLPRFYDVSEGRITIDGMRHPRREPREPARADRPRDPGDGALQRHRARQHRLRPRRRGRGAAGVGGARGLRPRLHPRPAPPLRHRHRRAGEPPLRRRSASASPSPAPCSRTRRS